jgi:DNA replication protein DnaC
MTRKNRTIEDNLSYLRLTQIRNRYVEAADNAAKRNISHLEFLAELVETEAAAREESAVARRLRDARLPFVKTLEQFRWSHPEKINRAQVENLFHLNFIGRKENVVFLGGCGLGKTHLATAIAAKACQEGHSVLFAGAVDIVNSLSAARAASCLDKALEKYARPQLLVMDELGYLPIDKLGADLLFQVISKRYERGSLLITTNRPFKKWAEIFNNDSTVTSAILDRVLHHCDPVVIEGKSYRMKDSAE